MKPPVPVPPRFPRSSVVCLVIIAFLAVLWVVGDRRVQSVAYEWQKLLPAQAASPANPPSGNAPEKWYALELSSVTFSNLSGAMYCVYGKYTSYDKDREELLKRWSAHRGWSYVSVVYKMGLSRKNPFSNVTSDVDGGFQILGFGVVRSSRQGSDDTSLIIPILYPMLLLSIPVIVAIRRHRRYLKRLQGNQCLRCGYVLGGASVCPECGTSSHRSPEVAAA